MKKARSSLTFLVVVSFVLTAVSVIAQDAATGPLAATALRFVPVSPCRVVDTRNPDGTLGGPPIQGGTFRSFPIGQGSCKIPLGAEAISLNVTVVPMGPLGFLTVWETGEDRPNVSLMNSLDGRIKANAAIVQAGINGAAVSVYATNTTNVVLDVNGYFTSEGAAAFYPLPPCRVADTRNPKGPLGGPFLPGGQERVFPVLQAASCNIPSNSQAYSLNITAVPRGPLGYVTVWPAGQTRPVVSTLNALTGTVTANAAVVVANNLGDISVFPSNDTDLVIDINGYFAPPAAGGLSLSMFKPCRVLDTRQSGGAFSGQKVIDVVGSSCGIPPAAEAFVLNATVVPAGPLGYLTLWPDGTNQPLVSTLNAVDGAITSNMAIVPTNNGKIDAFATNTTQLVVDSSGYFAP